MRTIAVLIAALVLALAGCGGDDDENGGGSAATSTPTEEATPEATPEEESGGGGGGGGGGETIALAAPEDGSLVFEPETLTAAAGEVTIEFDNPSTNPHAVAIDGVDEESETVTQSDTSLTATLEAGEYTFYCPVTGHREGGMEGTLTVE
jgi:plastocyanin